MRAFKIVRDGVQKKIMVILSVLLIWICCQTLTSLNRIHVMNDEFIRDRIFCCGCAVMVMSLTQYSSTRAPLKTTRWHGGLLFCFSNGSYADLYMS